MQTIQFLLSQLCAEAFHRAFPQIEVEEMGSIIEEPKDKNHGDYASHIAMKYAKVLQKKPLQIAEAIVEHFPETFLVSEITILGPGFINFHLNKDFIQEKILDWSRGIPSPSKKNHSLIIDYTSTNAAKFIGAHHIITIFLGDALANLFEKRSYTVHRINHLGDWGTNFGVLIEAFLRWGSWEQIHENPCAELNKLYVRFHQEAEANPSLMDIARERFKKLEENDEESLEIWRKMVHESIIEIDQTLSIFGIKVEHIGESFYLKQAKEVIQDGLDKKMFREGEGGSLIYPFENPEETPALIQKSDGTSLYLTRDLATIRYRVDTWHPDAIFYVVDYAQSLHFKQTFHIAKALHYNQNSQLEHIAFGRMSFADKSMSTRKGNIIPLLEVYEEACSRAKALAESKGPKENVDLLAKIIAKNSLKYGVLNQDRVKDIIFEWDRIISLEGNSAPYLMYSLARITTILEKAGNFSYEGIPQFQEKSERDLNVHLLRYPEVLEKAERDRKLHGLCTYLFELCQHFNRFYGECPILNAEDPSNRYARLVLVRALKNILEDAFEILGLESVAKM